MVKNILTAAVACVALLAVTCINPSSPNNNGVGLITADQYEPDNTQQTAKQIHPDSGAQVRTLKRGDTDWVYFTAASGKSYKIFTTGSTDTKILVYSSSGTVPIVQGDDSPGSLNALVVFNCTSSGTYYICVCGNDETVSGAYDLVVNSSVGLDSYEPDSIPKLASTITTSSYQSRSLTEGDIDWVSCYISLNDTVLLTAAGSCRIAMSLYDRDTVTLLTTAPTSDSVATIRYRAPASGYYFVKITAQSPTANGSYRLTMQTSSSGTLVAPDAYESDNTRSTAKLLPSSSVTQLRSLTVGDTDWVALPVVGGRQYTLSFSNSSYVLATMFAKDGTILQGPSYSLSLNSSATDTVFVKIYSSVSTAFNYILTLTVFLQPTIPDDYEIDNTKLQAKAKYVARDSFIQDRTLTVTNSIPDTDWVAFPTYAGKQYTFRAITSLSTTLYMYLYDNISSSYVQYSSSSSSSIVYTPTVSDTMYLMIYRPASYGAVAYTLSVQGQFYNDSYEPDSTRALASTLTSTQSHVLLPRDTDWVKYTAAYGDSIAVFTTGNTDTKIDLFSSSGSAPIMENDDISTSNTNALVSWKSAAGGMYYIRVTGKTPSSTGAYVLQVLSVSNGTLVAADSFENDNSQAKARVIKDTVLAGEAHSLTLNDTDWIGFEIPAGAQYTVTATSNSSTINMYAYTAKDSLVASRLSTYTGTVSYMPAQKDTLYCKIASSYTIQRYTISMSRVAPPAPDAYENDNTRASAYKATGSFSQVRTLTPGDSDWVAVPVVAGGRYTMSSTSSYVMIALYNQAGTLLASPSAGSLAFTASAADTFFYLMTAVPTNPAVRYTLTLSVVLPILPDAYENDNTPSTAKAITTDSSVQDRTITLGDTDYAYFRGNAGDVVTIRAAHNASYYTYLYLYDSAGAYSGAYLNYNYSTGYGTYLTYTLPKAGLYYARVNSLSTGSFAYSLTASLKRIDTLTVGVASSRTLASYDTQWVAVKLDSGKTYSMQTTGSLDMRIWLYDSVKAPAYLAFDDNSGGNYNALFTYTPHRSGLFYVKVCGTSYATSGSFGLVVWDNSVQAPVVGVWNITYNWSGSSSGSALFTLSTGGTFTVGGSSGTWTYVGNVLTLYYSGSTTIYTGTVTGQTVSGTMSGSGSTGTFTGLKQ